MILDYFWSPASEWTRTHWSRNLFEKTLPALVLSGLLAQAPPPPPPPPPPHSQQRDAAPPPRAAPDDDNDNDNDNGPLAAAEAAPGDAATAAAASSARARDPPTGASGRSRGGAVFFPWHPHVVVQLIACRHALAPYFLEPECVGHAM